MTGKCIAVTRPLPDGARTASAVRAAGHDVVLSPLLRIEPVAADLAGAWSAVIVTSQNAARAVAVHRHRAALIGLPVFAVGEQTANAAREAGFAKVTAGGRDAGELIALLTARAREFVRPLLYIAGEERAADIAGAMARVDVAMTTAVVYRAARLPFSADLVTALQGGALDVVLHFSKRSAESFLAGAKAAAVVEKSLVVRHLCLSAQVAAPLVAAGAKATAVAPRPEEAALLALI